MCLFFFQSYEFDISNVYEEASTPTFYVNVTVPAPCGSDFQLSKILVNHFQLSVARKITTDVTSKWILRAGCPWSQILKYVF